jgi:hypothetical protein
LDDTPRNIEKERSWLERVIDKIEKGRFVFAEAFPGASIEKKKIMLWISKRNRKLVINSVDCR